MAFGAFKPLNTEQKTVLEVLTNDKIRVVVLTGASGSGKTILSLAAYLASYKNFGNGAMISRLMVDVGRALGTLPGFAEEKLDPYLICFDHNLSTLTSMPIRKARDYYKIKPVPIQLLRGASMVDCFVIIDEAQMLSEHELLTIGTRISKGSKLVLLGDLAQVDGGRNNKALITLVKHPKFIASPIAKHLHLSKTVRGKVTELFMEVFPGEENE